MLDFINTRLEQIRQAGNFRTIPGNSDLLIDFSSNDYLGLATDKSIYRRFLEGGVEHFAPTSSASRLLASEQSAYTALENTLECAYDNRFKALVFNSGYHANVVILADKLVHASIIDGMKLGGGVFARFAHNDVEALERLILKYRSGNKPIMVVVESVYSMDGDQAPIDDIIALKHKYGNILLYVDEAHALGVCGYSGLGVTFDKDMDIIVGTFGKALAGQGAFILSDSTIRDYLVNTARSFIFSTALPPLIIAWNEYAFKKALTMDTEREHLSRLSQLLQSILGTPHSGHIQPLIVGDAARTVRLSQELRSLGFSGVAIRTPTVPAGTERIRFSLSASLTDEDITNLGRALTKLRTT